ncbi:MAG: Deoxyribodipyrimidine photo-lyase [Pseudomonadota bacterium]
MSTIVWFRRDLRLDDHPALSTAVKLGEPVIPVYIHSPDAEEGDAAAGSATKWWLHHSLQALKKDLEALGSRLILRAGPAELELLKLVKETKSTAVYWHRRYEPSIIARDSQIKAKLKAIGCEAESLNGALLYEPWTIKNKSGDPYKVYTPYWRACLASGSPAAPEPRVSRLPAPSTWPKSLDINQLELKPKIPWDKGMESTWTPGEKGADSVLKKFLPAAPKYIAERDFPAISATSQLSSYLALGEISPRRIWATMAGAKAAVKPGEGTGGEAFLRQLGWREFAYHLLYHFPATVTAPLRPEFSLFPWESSPAHLKAWQRGLTGYPIVDAGMRQLWHTGWMHNRVRMIVGSFLVKDLLITWQEGAKWFWDTLVDADLANNTLGWQWIGGCGADAAPYFRVFNPLSQSEKFDAAGTYLRRWCPELARLPAEWIHRPFEAPKDVLNAAGVTLGKNYPRPLVDHGAARLKALKAFSYLQQDKKKAAAEAPRRKG